MCSCGSATSTAPKSTRIGCSRTPNPTPWGRILRSDAATRAMLAIHRGDARDGVESLQGSLEVLHAARYELLTPTFNISLAEGLAALGRLAEGIALIDQTIGLVEANGDLSYLPEVLRVKGNLLLAMPRPVDRRRGSVPDAVAQARPSSRRARLGAAHGGRPGGAMGGTGKIRRRPGAAAAGVRPVYRGAGYGGCESRRTAVGHVGLASNTLPSPVSGRSSCPLPPRPPLLGPRDASHR